MSKFTMFKTISMAKKCIVIMLLILVLRINSAECRNIELTQIIDQCRARCLGKFLFEAENVVVETNCQEHNNCAMCWDFCEILIMTKSDVFHNICTNYTCVSIMNFQFIGDGGMIRKIDIIP